MFEIIDCEKEAILDLEEAHKYLLECENPIDIIKGYCWDITFDIEEGDFIGFDMLIDPTYKIYLSVGGEGFLSCDNGRYEIPIDDKLNTALFETVEVLYKHGMTCDYLVSM